MVKRRSNFTLETLLKIERVLDIELIKIEEEKRMTTRNYYHLTITQNGNSKKVNNIQMNDLGLSEEIYLRS